jgi:hypothetical protein
VLSESHAYLSRTKPEEVQVPLILEEEGDPNFSIFSIFLGKMSTLRREQAKSRHLMRATDGTDDDRKILQAWHISTNVAYVSSAKVGKAFLNSTYPINDKITAVFERTA